MKKVKNGVLRKWIDDHVSFNGEACLIWPFNRCGKGYAGFIHQKGQRERVTSVMCSIVNGPPPTEQHTHAAHSCGKGIAGCIHPKHLRWATPAENEADKLIHGTVLRGSRQPLAKLTEAAVRKIRRSTASQEATARRFGVSRNAVRQVLDGKTWSHVA